EVSTLPLTDEAASPAATLGAETQRPRAAPSLWITAERRPQLEALFADARFEPNVSAPAEYAKPWTQEAALVELIRGRLEALGPVPVAALAAWLGISHSQVDFALAALQAEGFAMRGRFSPGAFDEEWCDRRLLARIHRYTVKRLRAEIEPVLAKDFMRFLLE